MHPAKPSSLITSRSAAAIAPRHPECVPSYVCQGLEKTRPIAGHLFRWTYSACPVLAASRRSPCTARSVPVRSTETYTPTPWCWTAHETGDRNRRSVGFEGKESQRHSTRSGRCQLKHQRQSQCFPGPAIPGHAKDASTPRITFSGKLLPKKKTSCGHRQQRAAPAKPIIARCMAHRCS